MKAALSVSLANKSVGGSTHSSAAFVFLQQFFSRALITAVCSVIHCMLIGCCPFYPLNSDTLTPVLTGGHFSKQITKCPLESERKGTEDKVAENKARLYKINTTLTYSNTLTLTMFVHIHETFTPVTLLNT